MIKVNVQARDKDVKAPHSEITLFDIKNAYIGTGKLEPELIDALFSLTDYTIDRLLFADSERFRNNY